MNQLNNVIVVLESGRVGSVYMIDNPIYKKETKLKDMNSFIFVLFLPKIGSLKMGSGLTKAVVDWAIKVEMRCIQVWQVVQVISF